MDRNVVSYRSNQVVAAFFSQHKTSWLCDGKFFVILIFSDQRRVVFVCLFIIHIHNSTFMSSILFLEFRYEVDKSYYMIHLVAFHNNNIIFPLMKVCCVYKEVISK